MIDWDTIDTFDAIGRLMAKHAAEISAANRMSSALSAVRTNMGAVGGPKSAGRVVGAPSLHAPSAQGVPRIHAEPAPKLGFPQISKPPRM